MPVKVAFVGTGIVAHSHLEILARDPDVKVVGLCDIVREKARAAVKRYGGRAYTDYRKMLDTEEPDAVYLCVPPFAHQGQEFDVIERGAGLFVENPVALDIGYAERVAAAAEAAATITSVGYVWRYTHGASVARERLRRNPVALVRGAWLGQPRVTTWWREREKSGGQFVEQVAHLVDLARFLVGDVRRLYARGSRRFAREEPRSNIEDSSVVVLEFANGAVGEISQTCILDFDEGSALRLYSRRQIIELTFESVQVKSAHKQELFRNRRPPLELENEAFLEAVRTRDSSGIQSSYADAIQTLNVTLAANYSMESGDVVRL
jgi:predicted dehydrogenase